jgi:hypothetical protein
MQPGIKRKLLSQSFTVSATPQTNTVTFNMPAGYSQTVGMYFKPSLAFLVTIASQKADNNIIQGFSTDIGNYGFIEFYNDQLPTDILTLTAQYIGAFSANFTATFTLAFM